MKKQGLDIDLLFPRRWILVPLEDVLEEIRNGISGKQNKEGIGYPVSRIETMRYTYNELMARDKVNLDIFWLRDESLDEWSDLREPDEIAQEMIEDLEAAVEQLQMIVTDLGDDGI